MHIGIKLLKLAPFGTDHNFIHSIDNAIIKIKTWSPDYAKLQRIAEKARQEPNFAFTSLFHLVNVELLWECFAALRGDAVAGIGGPI